MFALPISGRAGLAANRLPWFTFAVLLVKIFQKLCRLFGTHGTSRQFLWLLGLFALTVAGVSLLIFGLLRLLAFTTLAAGAFTGAAAGRLPAILVLVLLVVTLARTGFARILILVLILILLILVLILVLIIVLVILRIILLIFVFLLVLRFLDTVQEHLQFLIVGIILKAFVTGDFCSGQTIFNILERRVTEIGAGRFRSRKNVSRQEQGKQEHNQQFFLHIKASYLKGAKRRPHRSYLDHLQVVIGVAGIDLCLGLASGLDFNNVINTLHV